MLTAPATNRLSIRCAEVCKAHTNALKDKAQTDSLSFPISLHTVQLHACVHAPDGMTHSQCTNSALHVNRESQSCNRVSGKKHLQGPPSVGVLNGCERRQSPSPAFNAVHCVALRAAGNAACLIAWMCFLLVALESEVSTVTCLPASSATVCASDLRIR